MPERYRERRKSVEAIQFASDSFSECAAFMGLPEPSPSERAAIEDRPVMETPDGQLIFSHDWIVKNRHGVFTVYEPEVFAEAFELIGGGEDA